MRKIAAIRTHHAAIEKKRHINTDKNREMRDGKRGRIAKRVSGERPLRRRPIFVFFAVISVAARVLVAAARSAAACIKD